MSSGRPTGRGRVAVGLSVALLIALPAGGFVAGAYAAFRWDEPEGPVCGLGALLGFVVAGGAALAGGLAGLAAGAGAGWGITLALFRWANRCPLGEIRDDPPAG